VPGGGRNADDRGIDDSRQAWPRLFHFAVRNGVCLFGCGGQDTCDSLLARILPGRLGEPAGELFISDGKSGFEKGEEGADLPWRQGVDKLVESLQVTDDYSARWTGALVSA
jgi:hypothetical protein